MKTKRNSKKWTPSPFQSNPDSITTDHVQYWHNGIMVTAQLIAEVARKRVKQGKAFVISCQAIGAVENGQAIS